MTPYDPITLFTPHWNSPETTDIQKATVNVHIYECVCVCYKTDWHSKYEDRKTGAI